MSKPDVSADRVRELLSYDPETGNFTWKAKRKGAGRKAGLAGNFNAGYIMIGIDGKQYRAHRLVWLWMYGKWPDEQIDHIDGQRSNNRRKNLREAPQSGNMQNQRRARSNNKCGFLGVFMSSQAGKWQAKIKVDGKQKHIGFFDTAEQASEAYLNAKRLYHPYQAIS